MDTQDPIRCTVVQGFKWHSPALGRHVLVGPGQEITVPPEEFERLRGLGAVVRAEDIERRRKDEEGDRLRLLRAHFKREPTKKEQADYARYPLADLGALLASQAKSQAEWEAAKEERLRQRKEREDAQALADAEKHQRAADRLKKRGRL